jgi:far upstream element-binding protein
LLIGSVQLNPQTGQPDYTAQWIQYYRSIGALKDAEALEQQMKASKVMGVCNCCPMFVLYT